VNVVLETMKTNVLVVEQVRFYLMADVWKYVLLVRFWEDIINADKYICIKK